MERGEEEEVKFFGWRFVCGNEPALPAMRQFDKPISVI
jgi:hypothetical protein